MPVILTWRPDPTHIVIDRVATWQIRISSCLTSIPTLGGVEHYTKNLERTWSLRTKVLNQYAQNSAITVHLEESSITNTISSHGLTEPTIERKVPSSCSSSKHIYLCNRVDKLSPFSWSN